MKRLILLLCLLATPVMAVEPSEVLEDPMLEARARELSKGLRCLVCRNESIDESNAELARDLRLLVRERLLAGDTNAQTLEFIVNRYGEYVLLKPNRDGANLMLWVAGPGMLVVALLGGAFYVRRRSEAARPETLSAAETARLRELLDE